MSPDDGVPVVPEAPAGVAGAGGGVAGAGGGAPVVPPGGRMLVVPGDDLALVAARFGAALRAAGVPADPGRCERFASAVTVARPVTVSGLYLCALATLVASKDHIETLQRVFEAIFGGLPDVPAIGSEPPAAGPPETTRGATPAADILREAAQ